MIKLVKTTRNCAMLEKTPRYDVFLNGVLYGQLYFNLKGYVGYLPTPEGRCLSIGESSISAYKKTIAQLNREFRDKKEDDNETQRRDEKHGLYPQYQDSCN